MEIAHVERSTHQVARFHLLLQHRVVQLLPRVHQGLVSARDDLAAAGLFPSERRRMIGHMESGVYVPSCARCALERLCGEPKTRPHGFLGWVIEFWDRNSGRMTIAFFVFFVDSNRGARLFVLVSHGVFMPLNRKGKEGGPESIIRRMFKYFFCTCYTGSGSLVRKCRKRQGACGGIARIREANKLRRP